MLITRLLLQSVEHHSLFECIYESCVAINFRTFLPHSFNLVSALFLSPTPYTAKICKHIVTAKTNNIILHVKLWYWIYKSIHNNFRCFTFNKVKCLKFHFARRIEWKPSTIRVSWILMSITWWHWYKIGIISQLGKLFVYKWSNSSHVTSVCTWGNMKLKNKIKIGQWSFALNPKTCFKRGCVDIPSEAAPAQLLIHSTLLKLLTFEVESDNFPGDLLLTFKWSVISLWSYNWW